MWRVNTTHLLLTLFYLPYCLQRNNGGRQIWKKKKKQKPCAIISSYSSARSVGTGKGDSLGRRWRLEGYGHQHHPVPQDKRQQEEYEGEWTLHGPKYHIDYMSFITILQRLSEFQSQSFNSTSPRCKRELIWSGVI